ncbi:MULTISPECIES: c-type cytochrome [unclassified Rhizobium]|uniref:c-type cytochrome n=1 Tax=unclassified Rhizobium TaxID=2613769 RepID=UPI0007152601|nr:MULTISPECIES: cytochrome c family protein [unclassified Rhizobium]KQS88033.1 cytochrome C [Rhizobium sp. Leaf386]KQS94411.1 cytochrome C [Rhizobium sp. Leaf391]KQU01416.1 cytochrome C [Rhizobium sp. Leaf453]
MRFAITFSAMTVLLASPALADGDAVAGKAVFGKCMACHTADQPKNRVGPTLMGVVGRPAAAVGDYTKYSPGMKKAGMDGMVWDEKTLAHYLATPKTAVPGTKMMFAGLKSETDIANVIAYLKAHPAP